MKWKIGLYLFSQWLFLISVLWFSIGLIIVGSKDWWLLCAVPLLGLTAIGYTHELKQKV